MKWGQRKQGGPPKAVLSRSQPNCSQVRQCISQEHKNIIGNGTPGFATLKQASSEAAWPSRRLSCWIPVLCMLCIGKWVGPSMLCGSLCPAGRTVPLAQVPLATTSDPGGDRALCQMMVQEQVEGWRGGTVEARPAGVLFGYEVGDAGRLHQFQAGNIPQHPIGPQGRLIWVPARARSSAQARCCHRGERQQYCLPYHMRLDLPRAAHQARLPLCMAHPQSIWHSAGSLEDALAEVGL